jgi:hypothetical protein
MSSQSSMYCERNKGVVSLAIERIHDSSLIFLAILWDFLVAMSNKYHAQKFRLSARTSYRSKRNWFHLLLMVIFVEALKRAISPTSQVSLEPS